MNLGSLRILSCWQHDTSQVVPCHGPLTHTWKWFIITLVLPLAPANKTRDQIEWLTDIIFPFNFCCSLHINLLHERKREWPRWKRDCSSLQDTQGRQCPDSWPLPMNLNAFMAPWMVNLFRKFSVYIQRPDFTQCFNLLSLNSTFIYSVVLELHSPLCSPRAPFLWIFSTATYFLFPT